MLPGPGSSSAPPPAERPLPRPSRQRSAGPPCLLVALTCPSDARVLGCLARELGRLGGLRVELSLHGGPRREMVEILERLGEPVDRARTRRSVREVVEDTRPSRLLVRGSHARAAALARCARRAGVAVAHLAEIRSGGEGARREATRWRDEIAGLADLHLVPDEDAREALVTLPSLSSEVCVVGDLAGESMLALHERLRSLPWAALAGDPDPWLTGLIEGWSGRLVLVHARGREVLDELCVAVRRAAARHPDWLFVWPVVPHPGMQARVHRRMGDVANVVLCDGLTHAAHAWLLGRCDVALSDARSFQEDAAALSRPVLATRAGLEPAELAHTGLVRPVGTSALGILAGLERLLLDPALQDELRRRPRSEPRGAAAAAAAVLARATIEAATGVGAGA